MTSRPPIRCARAARLGDRALNSSASGTAISGSANVLINNRSVLRVNDTGVHSAHQQCCPEWQVTQGARRVQINTLLMARIGDATQHCNGEGSVMTGSSNVLVGDWGARDPRQLHWIHFVLRDRSGEVVPYTTVTLVLTDGRSLRARSDSRGNVSAYHINPGLVRVRMARIE